MATYTFTSNSNSVLVNFDGKEAPFGSKELHPYTLDNSGGEMYIFDSTGVMRKIVKYMPGDNRLLIDLSVDTVVVDGESSWNNSGELVDALRAVFFLEIEPNQLLSEEDRTAITGSIASHGDVNLSGVSLLGNSVLRYNGTEFIPCLHMVILSRSLEYNDTNVFSDKIRVNIPVQRLAPHKFTINYQWSTNDPGQDFVARAYFGGAHLQSILSHEEIHRESPPNADGGGDGRGTDQKLAYSMTYLATPTSTGSTELSLEFAGGANSILAAMWEASIEVEELVSVGL